MAIAFNYVFSNGDAHLKNFSLCGSEFGDHILTPAYDLICTSLHFPEEARTALDLFDAYCTHSLGPIMVIPGTRPTRVVALPAEQKLAGYIYNRRESLEMEDEC